MLPREEVTAPMNKVLPNSGPTVDKTETKAEPSFADGQPKEVDYYLNPTELFRWINYRRWDGAKARVLSHPDECCTWIVSRHSTDGRILWRHLPLHLVCMQSENGGTDNQPHSVPSHAQNTRQIEELIDILLEAYPDAASSPDDQGMLPLHLAVTSSTVNARTIHLLLMAYPNGVSCKNKFGRTPIDLMTEKKNEPNYDAVLRAMSRVHRTTERLTSTIRKENSSLIKSLEQSSSNERSASQQIMLRLEEELMETRKRMEELESTTIDEKKSLDKLRAQIEMLQSEKEEKEKYINVIKSERDEVMNQNEILRNQVQEHESIVQALHQESEHSHQDSSDTIARLKSEYSTAKAMAEALESQLRSRFTNEEYLTASISQLETELSDLRAEYKREKARLLHERDSHENENIQLQRSIEALSKKCSSLQSKLTEVNKQMSAVLGSHGALNAEHDRMAENNLRVETDLVECMRMERTNLLASMRKQLEFFGSAINNQEQLLENCEQKETQLLDLAKTERDKSFDNIKSLRQNFLNARTSALERQRTLQTDKLAALSFNHEVKQSLNDKDVKTSTSNDSSLDCSTISQRRKVERTDSSDYSTLRSRSNKKETGTQNSLSSYLAKDGLRSCDGESLDHSTISQKRREKRKDNHDYSGGRSTSSMKDVAMQHSLKSSGTIRSDPLPHPARETRVPISSDKFNSTEVREQPVAAGNEIENNLLHLLEARANQENSRQRRQESENDSDAYETSTTSSSYLTSSYRQNESGYQKPRVLNMPRTKRLTNSSGASTGASSFPDNTVVTTTTVSSAPNVSKTMRKLQNLSLDTFSNSSGISRVPSSDESDSESSNRSESFHLNARLANNKTQTHFPGMATGLQLGMIRISEEGSVREGREHYIRSE
mmetsp:Transcript_5407/g.7815  ORF Transcript_5407/g.7815 Transcript_5407/m.7815 type:complete len:892 (+) Transcript_5407:119-2794(+)